MHRFQTWRYYPNTLKGVDTHTNNQWWWFKVVVIATIVSVMMILIVTQLKDHYTDDVDPVLMIIKEKIAAFEPRVNDAIFHVGEKSYTINKKHVYMCLKDENQNYYDENMLMYVALHELAHVFCSDKQHTEQFKRIFGDLLRRAAAAGVYNMNAKLVENYCNYTS